MEATIEQRLSDNLLGWVDPTLVDWVRVAARAFDAQLREVGGVSHRELADPIAEWLGMESRKRESLGSALDMLQVAFDLADNVADAEDDARQGKDRQSAYRGMPLAVRVCLPAYLVATSREQIERAFENNQEALRRSGCLSHDILGKMVLGQGTPRSWEKARLVSGAQARLLCLPAWLSAPHPALTEEVHARLERWAEAWGTSWELQFVNEECRTPQTRAAYTRSLQIARACWPDFGPFRPGQPLSAGTLLPGVC